jgi:hypothetical protein
MKLVPGASGSNGSGRASNGSGRAAEAISGKLSFTRFKGDIDWAVEYALQHRRRTTYAFFILPLTPTLSLM